MAIENRTGPNPGLKKRLNRLVSEHQRALTALAAAAGGYVMANANVYGGVSPFGVAFCAALPSPYSACAAAGAVLGYIFTPNQPDNMKYLTAVVLALTLRWLFAGFSSSSSSSPPYRRPHPTWESTTTALLSLAVSGTILILLADATLYEVLYLMAEVVLCGGSAYFFARALFSLRTGWGAVARADVSCMVISLAVMIMGLSAVTIGGLSVGRILGALVVLLCAGTEREAGGAVAGVTAGVALGLAGGDFGYTILAYGFGGLIAGVFSGLGRIGTAAALVVVNGAAALATQSSAAVYTVLLEMFVASLLYAAIPQSLVSRFRISGFGRAAGAHAATESILQDRLADASDALRDIGHTTREVGDRLKRMDTGNPEEVYTRAADHVCQNCGMRTTCWQFKYTDTMNALNDAMRLLKQEGTVQKEKMPRQFTERCCRLDSFLAELNSQFAAQVAREGAQRKISRVREVVVDQFEGLALMLDELSDQLRGLSPLDAPNHNRVKDYFAKNGFAVEQVRCATDRDGRILTEVSFPPFQAPRLDRIQSAAELSTLLDAEMDQPAVITRRASAAALYAEKADFTAEFGAHQILPSGNRLCGDAFETIPNQRGKAHFILSDGMGSGGGAAVDSNLAADLLARLITVGFSHESALKMVNSALLIKSGEESLATVDICTIDLYTGLVDFYKAGAAPTFVLRSGRPGYVESTSLPAGILQGVSFDHSSLALREGDILVMVSDGVVATGNDWVKSELLALSGTDMQLLAEKLAVTAKLRRADDREDDITVLAIALRSGV